MGSDAVLEGVGLAMRTYLFKDIHFVTNAPLKPNNTINACLINPKSIFIMFFN